MTSQISDDRKKGTGRLFKPGIKGYSVCHTKGNRRLRIHRDDRHVTVDAGGFSGSFGLEVFRDGPAAAGIKLVNGQSELGIYIGKNSAIEDASVVWNAVSNRPNSIKTITCQKGLFSHSYAFNRKNKTKKQNSSRAASPAGSNTSENYLPNLPGLPEKTPLILAASAGPVRILHFSSHILRALTAGGFGPCRSFTKFGFLLPLTN